MNFNYAVPRISGTLFLILSLGVSFYLYRVEPLIPLLFAGGCLVTMSEYWKKLRLEKNRVFLGAEKYISSSIRILGVGFVVNLLTATIATVLHTGFSLYYVVSMTVGMSVALAGVTIATGGILSARKKLGQ